MTRPLVHFAILFAFPVCILAITTTNHDKPETSRIHQMATKMQQQETRVPLNLTHLASDRQKRLLPYINYYSGHNYQKPSSYRVQRQRYRGEAQREVPQNEKYTPFLESNALPGPFVPISKNPHDHIKNYVQNSHHFEETPNYPGIYEKLARLKLIQHITKTPYVQSHNTGYRKPQINYVPVHHYEQQYKNLQAAKTVVETYTPTNIDIAQQENANYQPPRIPIKNNYNTNQNVVYKIFRTKPQPQFINFQNPNTYAVEEYDQPVSTKQYFKPKEVIRRPIILYRPKHVQENVNIQQNANPLVLIETKPKQVNAIIDDQYVAQKLTPLPQEHLQYKLNLQKDRPVQFVTEKYEPEYYPTSVPTISNTETTYLGQILKQLQDSNTLPQTITADNIDNSIKTLVNILNGLKKQQKFVAKPIVVDDENAQEEENVSEQPDYVPETVAPEVYIDTVEGGTPGRPGIDYPALSTIPQTSFNCKTQRYKGFFGDPHTNCQVWHYCDLNGGQASFLCPNGTIFSQVALTCDWWYNVKCSTTAQLYVLNERLYKYILPLSPKFPEDYSGPLVDKYLALKFKEMEEKMSKEKKGKESEDEKEDEDEKDDSDQLQDIQKEKDAKIQ